MPSAKRTVTILVVSSDIPILMKKEISSSGLERLQIYKTSKKTEIELLKAKKKKAEESD
jgi:hypothetical protein